MESDLKHYAIGALEANWSNVGNLTKHTVEHLVAASGISRIIEISDCNVSFSFCIRRLGYKMVLEIDKIKQS
ncbi:unnamed protein product [Strongylus vulgaris]|uniref:Uncharacterized protein n=1 Tax=Strongylus vulgaris TaxID=40348 RepID=A0A3P7JS81_STRVU|nr:unnamed protein product [Strongylus vulgaris]VDM83843.1 unnamed protein product [Strongylus vulgaris]